MDKLVCNTKECERLKALYPKVMSEIVVSFKHYTGDIVVMAMLEEDALFVRSTMNFSGDHYSVAVSDESGPDVITKTYCRKGELSAKILLFHVSNFNTID